MGLFDRLKKQKASPAPPVGERLEDCTYSGMRVEVMTPEGQLLFAAKLMSPRGTSADLYQYSETTIPLGTDEPIPAQIRGYNDDERKAVHLEGIITAKPNHVWEVEGLRVSLLRNDRAFFRLSINLDAEFTPFGGGVGEELPCKLLNISVGGASIGTDYVFQTGDRLRLKVKLMEERDFSYLFCEVLRIIPREDGTTEYGCRFLNLSEADQDKITENIFAAQMKRRAR